MSPSQMHCAVAVPMGNALRLTLPLRKRIAGLSAWPIVAPTPLALDVDIESAGSIRHSHISTTKSDSFAAFPGSVSSSSIIDLEKAELDCPTPCSTTSTTASTPGPFIALAVAPSPLNCSLSAASPASCRCPHVVLAVCETPVGTTPSGACPQVVLTVYDTPLGTTRAGFQATAQQAGFDSFWMPSESPSHCRRTGASGATSTDLFMDSSFMLV